MYKIRNFLNEVNDGMFVRFQFDFVLTYIHSFKLDRRKAQRDFDE